MDCWESVLLLVHRCTHMFEKCSLANECEIQISSNLNAGSSISHLGGRAITGGPSDEGKGSGEQLNKSAGPLYGDHQAVRNINMKPVVITIVYSYSLLAMSSFRFASC